MTPSGLMASPTSTASVSRLTRISSRALDLGDHGAIGAGVLVARKADAVAGAVAFAPASSSRAWRRRGSRPSPARPTDDAAGTRPDPRRARQRVHRERIRSRTRCPARRAFAARRCGSAWSVRRCAFDLPRRKIIKRDRIAVGAAAIGLRRIGRDDARERIGEFGRREQGRLRSARPGRAVWPLLQMLWRQSTISPCASRSASISIAIAAPNGACVISSARDHCTRTGRPPAAFASSTASSATSSAALCP